MRRHLLPSNGAAESFVSFIPLFAGSVIPSQIVWLQAGVLRYASKHPRAEFIAIVEGKRDVRPTFSRQRSV
jgi:hypothetical protein